MLKYLRCVVGDLGVKNSICVRLAEKQPHRNYYKTKKKPIDLSQSNSTLHLLIPVVTLELMSIVMEWNFMTPLRIFNPSIQKLSIPV